MLNPPLWNSSTPRSHEPDPSDPDRFAKWQEQRMARRLKGEYESAVLHLNEVVNSNLHSHLRISAIRIEGATNTRTSFLRSLVNPLLLSPSSTPSTLEHVLHVARQISHRLHSTDVFQSIEARLETSRDPLASADDVDLVFKTRERGRVWINSSTEVGNGEGSASITARLRNILGGAETLEGSISLGTTTRRSFNGLFVAPLTSDLRVRGEISVFGLEKDLTTVASCLEGVRGAKGVIRRGEVGLGLGMHELAYEAVLRRIGGLVPTASISTRESAGTTMKSSISHTWTRDTRDDRIQATNGVYSKLTNEIAGFGGNVGFWKFMGEGQFSRPILPGVTLSLSTRAGLILPFLGRAPAWSDRFQLGGPTSVRAFKVDGMGARDGADSLGGDLHWCTGLSLISDIPKKGHWPLKAHLWVNAGRLDTIDRSKSLSESVQEAVSQPSVSAGVGLIYRFDPVRVELNFGVPLVKSEGEEARRGIQVGMGLEFL